MATVATSPPSEEKRKKSTRENSHSEGIDVPILESGDRLHAGEFLRRFHAMPDLKKAELIQGIVYTMASPVNAKRHGRPDGIIQLWLGTYAAATNDVEYLPNVTNILGPDDVPQPDSLLRKMGDGASSSFDEDGYLVGPPELVVEIAASSASRDATFKKETYLRAGVKEYLLWRVYDKEIDWWHLDEKEGRWDDIPYDEEFGTLTSLEFPELVLDVQAAFAHDSATVLKTLQSAINS